MVKNRGLNEGRRGGCCAETGQSLAVGSDDGDQR